MKKVITMQDISCAGKCSLTVALPTLSAMGIETVVLPTAVLSTHTMFEGFTFHDMTDHIQPIIRHLKQQGFAFDAAYVGYLGSLDQQNIASVLFDTFASDRLKLLDPCMADNGRLYVGFDESFAKEMASLCAKADVICPNLTEASYLLGIPYTPSYDEDYIRDVLKMLTHLGPRIAVLTGISFEEGKIGAYAYDAGCNSYTCYFNKKEPEDFHGTGDLWASTFCGGLVLGKSLQESLRLACDFVKESIRMTLLEEDHNRYGVNFEQALPTLIKEIL